MKREEIIAIISNALKKTKAIKQCKNYQNNKGIQIITDDGCLFNILTVQIDKNNHK